MNNLEQYEFDRSGYLIIKNLLSEGEVQQLSEAVETLLEHAIKHVHSEPRKQSRVYEYHYNEEFGYHATGKEENGNTIIIEDFFNANPAFDFLVDHQPTMSYINRIVQGKIRINNSEIRVRFPGNATKSHMGGPVDHKHRYSFNQNGIDCMMVRMIYFIHDVTIQQGAFSVVPGTHKSNMKSPYGDDPAHEPGMIGLEVKAGDGILFTENLRHGGLVNLSNITRKTLHVGYGPAWMMSQNIGTMDEPQFVTEATLGRYTAEQQQLFRLK